MNKNAERPATSGSRINMEIDQKSIHVKLHKDKLMNNAAKENDPQLSNLPEEVAKSRDWILNIALWTRLVILRGVMLDNQGIEWGYNWLEGNRIAASDQERTTIGEACSRMMDARGDASFILSSPSEPPPADLGSVTSVLVNYVIPIPVRLRGQIDAASNDPGDAKVLHTWYQISCCVLLIATDSSLPNYVEISHFQIHKMKGKCKGHSKDLKEFKLKQIAAGKLRLESHLGVFVGRLQPKEVFAVILRIHVSLSLHSLDSLHLQGAQADSLLLRAHDDEDETIIIGSSWTAREHCMYFDANLVEKAYFDKGIIAQA